MLELLGYKGHRGCFTIALEAVLLIYAIVAIVSDAATPYAWGILIGAVMDILLAFIYRRATKRTYNRQDSYWSKKEELDDSIKDE